MSAIFLRRECTHLFLLMDNVCVHTQCVDLLLFVNVFLCVCVSSIQERKYSPEKSATMQEEMQANLMLDFKKNGNNLCFISYFIPFF